MIGRVKASIGNNIPVSVLGGRQSRGQFLGASRPDLFILVLVLGRSVKGSMFGRVKTLLALIQWF